MNFLKNLFGAAETVDVKTLVQNGALVVDVRTPDEFRSGHVKGAINIPLGTIASNASKLTKHQGAIVAYCRSGNRSSMAVSEMKAMGLEAYNGGGVGEMISLLGA